MTPLIYKLEFPDGRFYMGATKNFSARRRTHLGAKDSRKAINVKVREAFRAHPICGIYPIAMPLPGVPLHALEEVVLSTQQPDLNVNFSPSPLCTGYAGAKEFGGYPSIADYARARGIGYASIKKQARGLTFEQWLNKRNQLKQTRAAAKIGPPDPRKDPALTFFDGWVRKRDICVVPWSNYERRREKGWPEHKALLTPAWEQPVSASKVAKRYGVDPNTYHQRRCVGWTVYEALGLTPRPEPRRAKVKPRLITIDGKTRTLQKWAELSNLKPNVVYARLNQGWTEKQAVGLEPSEKVKQVAQKKAERAAKKVTRETYTHQGFTGTLGQICREFGYNYPVVSQRRYKGKPFDQWFDPVGCAADPYSAYVAKLEEVHSPEDARRIADEVFNLDWLQDETV